MKLFKMIISAFFPNRCASCGEIINEEDYLCEYCFVKLKFNDISKMCLRCGMPKKQCECDKRVFHYNGCVAPFENEEIAKAIMYRYKFARIYKNCDFLSQQMALSVRNVYRDTCFDNIVFVPTTTRKFLKRGFNQSQELANGISKILKIPVLSNLLSCKNKNTTQHNLSLKQRFENVKGLYSFNYKINGKTILLVDDIRTTGATLDECAKQLILAGADKVYCVVALITNNRKDKNKNGN